MHGYSPAMISTEYAVLSLGMYCYKSPLISNCLYKLTATYVTVGQDWHWQLVATRMTKMLLTLTPSSLQAQSAAAGPFLACFDKQWQLLDSRLLLWPASDMRRLEQGLQALVAASFQMAGASFQVASFLRGLASSPSVAPQAVVAERVVAERVFADAGALVVAAAVAVACADGYCLAMVAARSLRRT
jgi:hypothetical protein